MNVGFIGLGLMGSRMANNLIRNGNQLFIYNRTKEKADDLINNGAKFTSSVAELASESEVIITMLSEPKVVKDFALGDEGFLNHLNKNSIWIDCSTVNPTFSKEMAKEARKKGVRFIDAPVSGTTKPAEKGELTFLIGGENIDIEYCRPLFEAMGKKIIHIGKNGMGTSIKMVINLLLAHSMLAFSEGILLGESLEISKEKLFEILYGGPVIAPFLAGKKEKLLYANFETEFPLQWMFKDLHLALISATEKNVQLPLTETAANIYEGASKSRYKEDDFSAIYEYIKEKI